MSGMFPARGVVLGFLIPGLREVVLVAIVALVLYGRGGHRLLMATKYGRSAAPWLRLVRIPEQSKARWGGRGQTASPKREPRGIAAWWLLRDAHQPQPRGRRPAVFRGHEQAMSAPPIKHERHDRDQHDLAEAGNQEPQDDSTRWKHPQHHGLPRFSQASHRVFLQRLYNEVFDANQRPEYLRDDTEFIACPHSHNQRKTRAHGIFPKSDRY